MDEQMINLLLAANQDLLHDLDADLAATRKAVEDLDRMPDHPNRTALLRAARERVDRLKADIRSLSRSKYADTWNPIIPDTGDLEGSVTVEIAEA